MATFDEYKKRIDLVEYAQHQGWIKDDSKSTSRATVMDKPGGDGRAMDTIVVYKGPEHDYFYTPNHSREKGDVISFERLKNGTEFRDINEKFASYLNEVHTSRVTQQEKQFERPTHNEAFQHNFRFQPLTNTDYLESRGINKDTLQAGEFQERIFNRTFSYKEYLDNSVNQLAKTASVTQEDRETIHRIGLEKYYSKPFFEQLKTIQEEAKETKQLPQQWQNALQNTYGYKAPEQAEDKLIVNTSFPLRNEHTVIAVINRNSDYNRVEMPKQNAVWTSRTDFDQRPVSSIVIHESPIDSLSYHQLNPPKQDEKRLYIATAGNMSNETPVLINKLIKESEAKTVILANDNDRGGQVANINLAGQLNINDKGADVHARLNVAERSEGRLLITINHQNQAEGMAKAEAMGNRFTEAINRQVPEGADKEAQATVIRNTERSTDLEVSFVLNRQNLVLVEQTLLAERGLENTIEVRRPVEKDYNEELKRANPYIVTYQDQQGREHIASRTATELDAYVAMHEKANERPEAQRVAIHTEIKMGEDTKRVELANIDQQTQKETITPEFQKRVEEQQKVEEKREQAVAELEKIKTGNVVMVDDHENRVARTDIKVEVDANGKTSVFKDEQYDLNELAREGTDGKDLQQQMNQSLASSSKDASAGQSIKDDHKDREQDNAMGR